MSTPLRRSGLIVAVLCFIAIVLGCGGIAGPVDRWLVNDIGLAHNDTRDQNELVEIEGEGDGAKPVQTLVPATVFAVGWNESHVIAKRHPREEPFGPFDRTQTEYYIVVVRNKKVYGPFDRAEFAMHCDLLSVSEDLDFTLTYQDLE